MMIMMMKNLVQNLRKFWCKIQEKFGAKSKKIYGAKSKKNLVPNLMEIWCKIEYLGEKLYLKERETAGKSNEM